MSNKSWDELSPEGKVLGVLLFGPLALAIIAAITILAVAVSFWEAWVALKVITWHTPGLWAGLSDYGLTNWWTLGWANVAVSTMIRHRQPSIKKQYLKDGWGIFGDMLIWGFVAPAIGLLLAWLAA